MSRTDTATHRRRPIFDRLQGLLALLVTLALMVAIPVTLVVLRGNPLTGVGGDWSALLDRLSAPDQDGSLFLAALTWLGWLAWASFALTVLVEAVAQLRGLPTPHLPALGPQQRAANVLVAAAALLFTVPLLHTTPARATTDGPDRPTAAPAPVSAPLTVPDHDHPPHPQSRPPPVHFARELCPTTPALQKHPTRRLTGWGAYRPGLPPRLHSNRPARLPAPA